MRQWNSEQVLGVFARRLRGRFLFFVIALLLGATILFLRYRTERENFADPVLPLLAEARVTLAEQASWLHAMASHPEVAKGLVERHGDRAKALRSFLAQADRIRSGLGSALSREQLDPAFLANIERELDALELLGFHVDVDREAWRELAARVARQLEEHDEKVRRMRASIRERERATKEAIAAFDERVAVRLADAAEWARTVEEEIAERFDGTRHSLAERTAFSRAIRNWWQEGTAPLEELERFWQHGLRTPRLRGWIELLKVAEGDLVREASSSERLARLREMERLVPEILRESIAAEERILRRLSDVSSGAPATGGDGLAEDVERSLGWFVREADLTLLRNGSMVAEARSAAQAFHEARAQFPWKEDPWTNLLALGKLADEHFAETGTDTLARWIAVLERARAEGLVDEPWESELRLALVARTFALPATGRDGIRYLENLEESGAFQSFVERRPFSRMGSLARMFGEILEASRGELAGSEIHFWNELVKGLLRVLIDVDRFLGDAALAASDRVNETPEQRARAFRDHPATKQAFVVRGEWNDSFRRDEIDTPRRALGDAVFRMLMFEEREVTGRLSRGPVEKLSRSGIERTSLAEGTGGGTSLPTIDWPPLPRASLAVDAERVGAFLDLGVPRTELVAWAGRLAGGEGWREGFEAPLEPCPLNVPDAQSLAPPLELELPPPPSSLPLVFDPEPFRLDPWERHRVSLILLAALLPALALFALVLFRRVLPASFTIGPGEDGVARLAIAGGTSYHRVRLRDPADHDPLLEWEADEVGATLRLHRALPAYPLTYRRRRSRRGSTSWVLAPREPVIHSLEDREFQSGGQRLALRGEGFTRNVRVTIGEVDLTPYVEESRSLSSWSAVIPDGVVAEGRRSVQVHWEGGAVKAGVATLGRTRLIETSLPGFAFTADGALEVEATFTLGNDRGEPVKLWRQGPIGPREALSFTTKEGEPTRGRRTIAARIDLPLGRQRIEIDTSSSSLTRSVWVLEAGSRVLSVLLRDADSRCHLEQRVLGPENDAVETATRRSLPPGLRVQAACFGDSELWVLHDQGLTRLPVSSAEGRAIDHEGSPPLREGDRPSCARLGERLWVALGNDAPGSGRLYSWDLRGGTSCQWVEWADEELLEIAHCDERVVYIARGALYDLAAPEEPLVDAGLVPGTGKARRLLRFLPRGGAWYAIDLQYRLRDLRDPARRELANLAAGGAFLDPLRILALDRRDDEVELLVRDATDPRRIGLLRRDAENLCFPRELGKWFTFEGEVLAANLESDVH